MKQRIKVIASQITNLEHMLLDAVGKDKGRYEEELVHARFELKQLIAKATKHIIIISCFSYG